MKLRIAFFSADLRDHPVGQLIVELIELLDRDRFEVLAFSFRRPETSALGQRICKAFDQFMDVSAMPDGELIRVAREMQLDIAINLSGHTAGSRTSVFAKRVAPIQIAYLGYPGTMGASYMDYMIADSIVCPPGSESDYTEKLIRLPHSFMPHDGKQIIASTPPTRADSELPENGFVFVCFNNHYKITPAVFDIWMHLLQEVNESVLWLSDGPEVLKANLRREAGTRGVAPERLVFAKRVKAMEDHLARYRHADLFLDTLPYNAHTTACDALWAGVPVLTLAGQSFAGRVGASLLHASGLPELVTESAAEYTALALKLARDPLSLQTIRNRLAAHRRTNPLFDSQLLAESMACALIEVHRQRLAAN